MGFNTASGKCCCNSSASRPCRYRAQVSIPQAVSAVASSPLFSLPFGQGLEMCGPHRRFAPLLPRTLRRIPQAVGAIATKFFCFGIENMKGVSIPQAVGAVTTIDIVSIVTRSVIIVSIPQAVGAVTSSPLFSLPFGQGLEMCGPHRRFAPLLPRTLRRIPQAVGAVATGNMDDKQFTDELVSIPQAVGAVATNDGRLVMTFIIVSFNTASGKYCCNDGEGKKVYNWVPGFQYRKR